MEADVTATTPVQIYHGIDAALERERVSAVAAGNSAGLVLDDMRMVLRKAKFKGARYQTTLLG
jgi:hypothetical protein